MFKDHCLLTWQPPKQNGGSDVTGYHIERCLATTNRWMLVTKDDDVITGLEHQLGDLVEGNEYEFRIIAENKVGRGAPSVAVGPHMAKDPWG